MWPQNLLIPLHLLQRHSVKFLFDSQALCDCFSLLLFRSKFADSCWGHSPRESLRNVCDCTQERKYEVNMLFLVHLTLSMSDLEENCILDRVNPTYICLDCPASGISFSTRPIKGQFLLLFIFGAPDTFADLEYGQKARSRAIKTNVCWVYSV